MLDRGGRTSRILLYLGIVGVLLVGLAVGVYQEVGTDGLTVVNVVVTGILSAALVILYFQQTDILDSQRELLTQEINRNFRQQHTETLRKRVDIWHGNPELEQPDQLLAESELNLPRVLGASFQSAPVESYFAFPEDETFHVIPTQLQGDRYLEDLLENHAPEIQETSEEIYQMYEAFVQLRSDFVDWFEAGLVRETNDAVLEAEDRFNRWIFELLVLLERGRLDSFDDLRDRARADFDQGHDGPHRDEPKLFFRVGFSDGVDYPVYVARWQDEMDQDSIRREQQAIEREVEVLIDDVLDQVEANRPYEMTVDAADTLDDAAGAVVRLENLLVEYHGRPIYPGDCEFLEETRI